MGNPDGGWFDDTPPHVVDASPADGAVSVKSRKVVINFNEFIKIEDAQNKVIVSPPQIEQAEIKTQGKRIVVELKDSLKEQSTYTIDFSDAITDNNEGNPMGNYTYSFSTGDHIDTLEVSGYCLNAENLEPIKGILVGLQPIDTDTIPAPATSEGGEDSSEANDTTVTDTAGVAKGGLYKPFVRISRTNGSGRFTSKGVAPGRYMVYALQDADGDYVFSQKSEVIAYNLDEVVPTWKPDVRQDTVWRDSLHIDNILRQHYTHFLPDDVTLMCFQEPQTDRSLLKTDRSEPQKFTLFFTYGSDSLPAVQPLNFPDTDTTFVIEASQRLDTITYWLRDTTLVNQDTLRYQLTYMMTDTLGQLVSQTDTLEALAKVSFEKRMKELKKEREKWEKEQEKKRKREEPYDSVMPVRPLSLKVSASGQISPLQRLYFDVPEPLRRCDTAAVHLSHIVDSVPQPMTYEVVQTKVRQYELVAQWEPGEEYTLEIDSAAFEGIYGQVSNPVKQTLKVKTKDEFSSLTVEISPNPVKGDSVAAIIVQLLDSGDKVVRQETADAKGVARFSYLKPSVYYLRAIVDRNGNGQWDTGVYDDNLQPEEVYYHPSEIECKVKWDTQRSWNLTQTPRFRQKPAKITKQKPDKEKQLRNRNIERARQLGKEYINGAQRVM